GRSRTCRQTGKSDKERLQPAISASANEQGFWADSQPRSRGRRADARDTCGFRSQCGTIGPRTGARFFGSDSGDGKASSFGFRKQWAESSWRRSSGKAGLAEANLSPPRAGTRRCTQSRCRNVAFDDDICPLQRRHGSRGWDELGPLRGRWNFGQDNASTTRNASIPRPLPQASTSALGGLGFLALGQSKIYIFDFRRAHFFASKALSAPNCPSRSPQAVFATPGARFFQTAP